MSKARAMKDYVEVKDRIAEFRNEYPDYAMCSEILFLDKENFERVVMKGWIADTAGNIIATGHAMEKVSDNPTVNRTSLIENCETSAWGRALANMGFKISNAVASREEMSATGPRLYTGENDQKGMLKKALRAAGITDPELAQTINNNLIESEVMDDFTSLTNFIKGYEK